MEFNVNAVKGKKWRKRHYLGYLAKGVEFLVGLAFAQGSSYFGWVIQTVEAVVSPDGAIRLLQPLRLPELRRALVTILDEEPAALASECACLSEAALAEDWNRPEEDKAWAHLQQAQ